MKKWLLAGLLVFIFISTALYGCTRQYTVTIDASGEGTTVPTPGSDTYAEGTSLTITAQPAAGWKFESWSGDVSGNSPEITFTADSDKNLTANFSKILCDLTITCNGEGTTSLPPGLNTYEWGTAVNIEAVPQTGWKFDGWSGDATGFDPIISLVMQENQNLTANFSRETYILALSASGEGTVSTADETSLYEYGSEAIITAAPAAGWQFDGWVGDVFDPASPSTTVIMDSEKKIIANFSQIPLTTARILEELNDISVSTETVARSFKWSYEEYDWTWEISIPQALYDYYKALPRSPTKDYSVYATHPMDDYFIEDLVEEIRRETGDLGYRDYNTISFAAAFVQSLKYTDDSVTTGYDEYPRYPLETLFDKNGDCEDTSILLAAILKAMGYDSVLIVYPGTDTTIGHCAVGVEGGSRFYGSYYEYENTNYFYIETTGSGWEIGDMPDEYAGHKARIYPLVPVPILTHEWTTSSEGDGIGLHITVENLGSAKAEGVYVSAGFDAGNDQWWGSKKSPVFDLDISESITANLSLIPPEGKHTRLIVQVVYEGYAVDESFSDWVDM